MVTRTPGHGLGHHLPPVSPLADLPAAPHIFIPGRRYLQTNKTSRSIRSGADRTLQDLTGVNNCEYNLKCFTAGMDYLLKLSAITDGNLHASLESRDPPDIITDIKKLKISSRRSISRPDNEVGGYNVT